MKFFIAFALIAAVASATFVAPSATISSELQEIIAAINSPSTDPATAAALEQILLESMGVAVGPAIVDAFEPISVGPAIVDAFEPISVGPAIIDASPISVGPAIVDFPLPDGGAVSAPVEVSPVIVSPAVVPSTPLTPASPLVQIILNINQAEAVESSPVAVAPVVVAPVVEAPVPITIVESAAEPIAVPSPVIVAPSPVIVPEAVSVVETAPVSVVETAPVSVVETAPVSVVETAPVVVEPVIIGTPILPSPAVTLPETLN